MSKSLKAWLEVKMSGNMDMPRIDVAQLGKKMESLDDSNSIYCFIKYRTSFYDPETGQNVRMLMATTPTLGHLDVF